MGDLATLWPALGGGVFAVLVVVIIAQLRAHAGLASEAARQVRDAEGRADAAEAREQAVRDKAAEREAKLQQQVDENMAARRRAEDLHAQVIIEVRRLQYRVGQLEEQVTRFAQTTGADP